MRQIDRLNLWTQRTFRAFMRPFGGTLERPAESLLLGLLMLGFAGCRADSGEPSEGARFAVQNLYVGADIAPLIAAESAEEIPELVARKFAQIQGSDFAARAGAIAAALARERPHLVGLQEVSSFRVQSPGDFLAGNPIRAGEVILDYLPILLEALRASGTEYREVARYDGMDVEVPLAWPDGRLDDVRLTDAGVILARADVSTADPRSGSFETNLVVHVGGEGGLPVTLLGGWASVTATLAGQAYRFVTTHLEAGDLAPDVQEAQARELLSELSDETRPVVLVGDFSSTPDRAMTGTYEWIREAGFVDLWQTARPQDPGATCCQAPDLRNPASMLSRRLDYVFYRGAPDRPSGPVGGVVIRRVGAEASDRTASGLWPSDHAGLIATLGGAEESGDD